MNKEIIVLLLKRDIQELNLLTEGFEKMTEFPEPLLVLAKQKAENILNSLSELNNATAPTELGEIDYQTFGLDNSSEPAKKQADRITSEKNNFDAPVNSDEEFTISPNHVMPEEETTFAANADENNEEQETEIETYEEIEHEQDNNLIIDDTDEVDETQPDEIVTEEVAEIASEPETHVEEPAQIKSSIIIPNKPTSLVDNLLQNHDDSLGETIANQKIDDIRQAINIGDRFRFQRELFNGNGEVMNKAIAYLNQLQKFEEAKSFLQSKFNWAVDNVHAEDFLQIVKRRY